MAHQYAQYRQLCSICSQCLANLKSELCRMCSASRSRVLSGQLFKQLSLCDRLLDRVLQRLVLTESERDGLMVIGSAVRGVTDALRADGSEMRVSDAHRTLADARAALKHVAASHARSPRFVRVRRLLEGLPYRQPSRSRAA